MKPTIIVALMAALALASDLRIVKHSIDTGARCLDGSPAALYYAIGSETNRNKLIIYFEGGGMCTGLTLTDTLQSCYSRSFTDHGSSDNYADVSDPPKGSALSEDPIANPLFHDWTRVFIPFCDGSQHQGSRAEPVSYKGRDLYFRGMNNTIQHFQFLNATLGLYSAERVVLIGASAGGIAVFHWGNYLFERSLNKQVVVIPDSGLFVIEHLSPVTGRPNVMDQVSNLVKLVNTEVKFPIPECSDDFGNDQVLCFSAGHLAKYQKAPFFIVQSQYDAYSIQNILSLNCAGKARPANLSSCTPQQLAEIEDYRRVTLQALRNLTTIQRVGIWAPTCSQHSFTSDTSFNSNSYRIPSGTGVTCSEAIAAFMENPSGQHIYIDDFGWPSNAGCSGLSTSQ